MEPLERLNTVNELPQKPVLRPVDTQDKISPILPLPPIGPTDCSSVTASTSTSLADLICEILPADNVTRPPNKRLSTVDYIHAKISASGPITTEDITSNILRNESSDRGPGNVKLSLIDETPTVDIAESLDHGTFGISSLSGFFAPECECGCALSHDDDIVDKRTTNGTQSPCAGFSTWQLCSIPIYHTEPRGFDGTNGRVNPRTSARHVILRSSTIMRDPGIRTHKRSAVGRQPIEASSPSMTPSPTNSPKFCILPVTEHRAESLARHPPYTPSLKASRNRSSTVCKQFVQGRSSKPEAAWNGSRRGALHFPNTRSPIVVDRLTGVSSPLTCDEDNAFFVRRVLPQFIPPADSKKMLEKAYAV